MSAPNTTSKAIAERQKRANAIAHANRHVRLEGQSVTPFMRQLQQRYVDGEITIEDIAAKLNAKYKAS